VGVVKLAWTLGAGDFLVAYSKLLPTCETEGCLNPAHNIELIVIGDLWWWARPRDQIGEDDWQELVYLFLHQNEGEAFSPLAWEGRPAMRRTVFEHWMESEGQQLLTHFPAKYGRRSTAKSRAKQPSTPAPARTPATASSGTWWQLFDFLEQQRKTQIVRFQAIVQLESPGQAMDANTAERNLARLYSRVARRAGGCWSWNWQESQFRLFRYGPWVDPRELLWWLETGTRPHGLGVRVASHNGLAYWCLNPSHSDIEVDTVHAALLLIEKGMVPTVLSARKFHYQDPVVQALRHQIHQAVEQREIPYRIDGRHRGITLWLTDVVTWWNMLQDQGGA
jgi:hypothetical protein